MRSAPSRPLLRRRRRVRGPFRSAQLNASGWIAILLLMVAAELLVRVLAPASNTLALLMGGVTPLAALLLLDHLKWSRQSTSFSFMLPHVDAMEAAARALRSAGFSPELREDGAIEVRLRNRDLRRLRRTLAMVGEIAP